MTSGWNATSGESWKEYLQRYSLTTDLATVQRESARSVVSAVSQQSSAILAGIDSGSRALAQRLGDEMEAVRHEARAGAQAVADELRYELQSLNDTLNSRLELVADELIAVRASVQWGFGQLMTRLEGMNVSLEELCRIAKTPVQTWAYNQFEIARENFRKQLYDRCLRRLDKAIHGDATSPGYEEEWRLHHLRGVVLLGFVGCDADLVDPAEAEKAFLLAARFAKSDEPRASAEAMLSAAWAAFTQEKPKVALEYCHRATELDPQSPIAWYQVAKMRMALDDVDHALPAMRKALDLEPRYCLVAAADPEFQRHARDLDGFLENVRMEKLDGLRPALLKWLEDAESWGAMLPEVRECQGIVARWSDCSRGGWGVYPLLVYSKGGFARDQTAVVEARQRGEARRKKEDLERKAHAAREEREQLERQFRARMTSWEAQFRDASDRLDRARGDVTGRAETDVFGKTLTFGYTSGALMAAIVLGFTLLGFNSTAGGPIGQIIVIIVGAWAWPLSAVILLFLNTMKGLVIVAAAAIGAGLGYATASGERREYEGAHARVLELEGELDRVQNLQPKR